MKGCVRCNARQWADQRMCRVQDAQDVQAARRKSLPPLQSVMDLTTAFQPPQRGEAPVSAEAAPSSAGFTLTSPSIHLRLLNLWCSVLGAS